MASGHVNRIEKAEHMAAPTRLRREDCLTTHRGLSADGRFRGEAEVAGR